MERRRAPRNTAAEVQRDPLIGLITAAFGGGIEAQEAAGQRDFVGSDTLPSDIKPNDRAALESAGFKFIGLVEGDELFQYVEMPVGWQKSPTDHSMWSDLIDPKGRRRGAIFYKAAFYDRSAHMSLTRRFSHGTNYNDNAKPYQVQDCGRAIYTVPLPDGAAQMRSWDVSDAQAKVAEAWLAEHYPEWENPAAYWD